VTNLRRALVSAAALGVVAFAVALAGAAPAVSTPVDVTNDVYANNEESLGMDPSGQLLAGAWNDWEFNDGCGFSYSTDGGDHWAHESFVPGMTSFTNDPDVEPLVPSMYAIAGDPSVAYNPSSHKFDVICQAFGTKTGNQIQLMATTFDPALADPNADENESYGAAAWRLPASPVAAGVTPSQQRGQNGHFPDHESITVDTGTGGNHHFGRLYVTWAEFNGSQRAPINLSYSDDDGSTWTGPILVSDKENKFDQDARPSVGPDGTVYVSWVNAPTNGNFKGHVVMIDKSTDGGAHWGVDQVAAEIQFPVAGTLPNSGYRVFDDAWSTVDQVSGKVVVVYNDKTSATGPSNIYTTHNLSAGNISGANWAAAARVKPAAQEQFFPWISSAPNGRVDLVFYDRSCDPAGDMLNCVTLASTSDSGTTWTTASLLSTGFDGDKYSACLAFGDPLACGRKFLGDYIAVASTNAKAQALWTGNGPAGMDVFSGRAVFGP
jgi:hypothetical protein